MEMDSSCGQVCIKLPSGLCAAEHRRGLHAAHALLDIIGTLIPFNSIQLLPGRSDRAVILSGFRSTQQSLLRVGAT